MKDASISADPASTETSPKTTNSQSEKSGTAFTSATETEEKANSRHEKQQTNQATRKVLTHDEREQKRKDSLILFSKAAWLTPLIAFLVHSVVGVILVILDNSVSSSLANNLLFSHLWWLSIVIAGVSIPISFFVYKLLLRERLLVRHRLYMLAGQLGSGSGFLEIAFPGMAFIVLALIMVLLKCRTGGNCSDNTIESMYILIMVGSIAISIWFLHLADYSHVSRELAADQTGHLPNTIEWLSRATEKRLDETRKLHEEIRGKETFGDELPDREIGDDVLKALLKSAKERLGVFESDKTFKLRKLMYGDVVSLFHPDYLPHLAHVYLKISQLRALNMIPRRIQLLGRHWTAKGLESEYVVVHDISELRTEYLEHVKHSNQAGSATNDEGVAEPKWKQRSLKKRAIVTVAPDGSLLSIAIEEERQFNI